MASARAIRSVNAVTVSKTAKKSLEVPGMCSGGSCDVEDRPSVSGGAGAVGGETEGDESGIEVLSTSTSLKQASHPSAGPLQNHTRPPPAAVEERRVAYIKTARWIKPEDNSAAALCVAPLEIPDALRPGTSTSASTGEYPLPEPGPYGGPSSRSVVARS